MNNLVLITGGAKSGKSEFAESLAMAQKKPVIYLATMPIISGDKELAKKILQHKERRPKTWRTVEAELKLAEVVRDLPPGGSFCLIDCLSLFVANILFEQEKQSGKGKSEELVLRQSEALLASMKERKDVSFLTVTNEVGSSIVPDNPLSRQYRDLLGMVNKEFAHAAKTVWLCCVGLPIKIKPGK